jgi:hypothetical protein
MIFLFIWTGCKSIIDYDERSVRDTLVVAGIIEPGKPVEIRLSETINRFDDKGFTHVTDKVIHLYEDEVYIGELQYVDRGRYVSNTFTATAGNYYRIEIEDNNGKVANAGTLLPMPMPVDGLDSLGVFINGSKRLLVTLKFDEPGNTENYYRLELRDEMYVPYLTSTNEVRIRMITLPGQINTHNNWLLRGMGFFNQNEQFHDWAGNRFLIFSDRYIQGNEVALELDMPYFRTDSVLGTNRKIYLQHISKDYFYYLRSVMQQSSTSSNPFNEPVGIHTNVTGGIGILAGFSQTVDSLVHINYALIDSLFPDIKIPDNLNSLYNSAPTFIGSRNLQDF